MTLGERIYALRTAKNLSQGDLAEALDVSRQSVSKWETDTSVPDLDKLVKLCDLFGVTMDELVRGEAPKSAEPAENKTKLQQWLENKRVVAALILLALGFVVRMFGPFGIMLGTYGLIPCAILCLVVKKHTVMWCGWILYLEYLVIVRAFMGEWILIWNLNSGATLEGVLGLISTIGLVGMIMLTANCIIKGREEKDETSL